MGRTGETDVLIAGAGPVGLMMACELRRHGVECRIIDPLPEPARQCKAIGIQPRTLEIWEDVGIATEAINAGLWLRGATLYVNGTQTAEVTLDLPEAPFGFLALPQYETERILTTHLGSCGTSIERRTVLSSFCETGDHLLATVDAAGNPEQIACQYLIGCDGAHSTVRRLLNLPFEGDRYAEQFMLGDVEVHWNRPHGWSYRFLHVTDGKMDDFLVCIPIPGKNRYRVSMSAAHDLVSARQPEHGLAVEGLKPTLSHIQESVDRLVPGRPTVGALRWSSTFGLSHRIVPRYTVGRVFLAGDAAHIHPPTGAQGMNTGIQDAYNLAWKLALVLKDTAHPALLDSYNAERLPIGQEVVGRTHQQAEAQRRGITETDRDRLMKDSQLLLNYRDSPWVGEDVETPESLAQCPRPGDRAPDVRGLRREGANFPLRLFDLLNGTRHVLLLSAEPLDRENSRLFGDIATFLEKTFAASIVHYVIASGTTNVAEHDGLRIVRDAAGAFRRLYGASTTLAYLVRPDGYIAYRCSPVRLDGITTYLNRIFR